MPKLRQIAQTLSQWSLSQSILANERDVCDAVIRNLNVEASSTTSLKCEQQRLELLDGQLKLTTVLDVYFEGEHCALDGRRDAQFVADFDLERLTVSRTLKVCGNTIYAQDVQAVQFSEVETVFQQLNEFGEWLDKTKIVNKIRKQCVVDIKAWLSHNNHVNSGQIPITGVGSFEPLVDGLALEVGEISIPLQTGSMDAYDIAISLNIFAPQEPTQPRQCLGTYRCLLDDMGFVTSPALIFTSAEKSLP